MEKIKKEIEEMLENIANLMDIFPCNQYTEEEWYKEASNYIVDYEKYSEDLSINNSIITWKGIEIAIVNSYKWDIQNTECSCEYDEDNEENDCCDLCEDGWMNYYYIKSIDWDFIWEFEGQKTQDEIEALVMMEMLMM